MINHPNRGRKKAAAVSHAHEHDHDTDYADLLAAIGDRFATTGAGNLFTTDAFDLFVTFLTNLPAEQAIHTCNACHSFVKHFGSLAVIDTNGTHVSALWGSAFVPEFYRASMAAMFAAVAKARVTGVFLSSDRIWGTPNTGPWTHMSATPRHVHPKGLLTAYQAMAAKHESFGTVARALADFTPDMLTQALRLLEADALARSEKFVGPVKWLADLHGRRASTRNSRHRDNILWSAIATAPEGYCHPRSSVIGLMLEDIAAGLPFDDIKARFNAKMHPLAYQRPQAPPSAGNIKAAEAAVEKLGIARSLERRFARVDEIETVWRPSERPDASAPGSVFGHLRPKAASVRTVDLPPVTMTWEKFARTVLAGAEKLEMMVPSSGNFMAYVTAQHADAPNIMKWSNPVSHYVYHGGSSASRWGLRATGWTAVTAISMAPSLWENSPAPYLGESLLLALEGAVDGNTGQGNALFPENLRGDMHGVRATVEAYSRRAEIGRDGGPYACGFTLQKGACRCTLRAFSASAWSTFNIDRWD